MFTNLTEGALLVIAILFLFLRNLRASLLTASVIPLSLLFAFLAMKRFGLTANLMSLGALDFGLIVDASVVMVENFVRRLAGAGSQSGAERQDVIRAAAFEVGRPIVFGIAIIVAVYIPSSRCKAGRPDVQADGVHGLCGGARLVAFSTELCARRRIVLFARSGAASKEHEDPGWFVKLRIRYQRALEWSLLHRKRVVGATVGLFAVALISVPFLGTEFMPKLDEGYLLIETRRIQSASLPHGIAVSDDVERTLRKFPEVSKRRDEPRSPARGHRDDGTPPGGRLRRVESETPNGGWDRWTS